MQDHNLTNVIANSLRGNQMILKGTRITIVARMQF